MRGELKKAVKSYGFSVFCRTFAGGKEENRGEKLESNSKNGRL